MLKNIALISVLSFVLSACTSSVNDFAPVGAGATNSGAARSESQQTSNNSGLRSSLPIEQASVQRPVLPQSGQLPQGSDPEFRRMIGQMLMLGFRGSSANETWPRQLAQQIERGEVGGVLFLGHNVRSASGVKSLTRLFGSTRASIQPLISIDQEGGTVQRLSRSIGFRSVPSAYNMANNSNTSAAFASYAQMAAALKAWGFNTNFGPVADLNKNINNPIIAAKGRAYSPRVDTTVKFSRAFIDAHRGQKVLTAPKHFPGHGSSRTDSHLGFTDISASWSQDELAPFQQLISDGRADMIMVGHLFLRQYAPNEAKAVPASLSTPAITGLLRNRLGFRGVVITDDLDMGAIRQNFSQRETILRAVRAGVDILMLSNSARADVNLPSKIISMLELEAQKDPLLKQNIQKSYSRIVRMKQNLR